MPGTTEQGSAVVRRAAIERERQQAEILAESALVGERAVAVLRVLTWVMLGVAFSGAEGVPGTHAPPTGALAHLHGLAVLGWFVFAVIVLVVLVRRARLTPAQARRWPLLFILVDYGVFTTLGLTTVETSDPQFTLATLAILLTFSVARFSTMHVVVSAALSIASYLVQGYGRRWLGLQGWLDWRVALVAVASYLCLAGVVGWANRRVRRMFVDVRRRENLARFLPAQVVAQVLESGGAALAPVQREVTILFSDIRDFTTLSERMPPAELLATLDDYFARMSEIVKGRSGMVNKFIGDGMLAVWGAPDALADHAARAVQAALDMRTALVELNAAREREQLAPLRIGIGVHTGEVAAGMLGGPDQHEYTVIGDAVNVASRLEGLTKKLGADVVVSEATWKACAGAFAGERVGAESVKGRGEAVVVYRVDRRA